MFTSKRRLLIPHRDVGDEIPKLGSGIRLVTYGDGLRGGTGL